MRGIVLFEVSVKSNRGRTLTLSEDCSEVCVCALAVEMDGTRKGTGSIGLGVAVKEQGRIREDFGGKKTVGDDGGVTNELAKLMPEELVLEGELCLLCASLSWGVDASRLDVMAHASFARSL